MIWLTSLFDMQKIQQTQKASTQVILNRYFSADALTPRVKEHRSNMKTVVSETLAECCSLEPFPERQILDSSKLKEFADDNFNLDVDRRKLYKRVDRKHCGKRRNCSLRAISPFPTVFSKDFYCIHMKTGACLERG